MTMFKFRIAEENDVNRWDSVIDRSSTATPFHRLEWLRAMEEESRSTLHLLVCEKEGEGTVCQLPLFAQRKGPLKVLLSPPSGCAIPYLGPVFVHQSEKQYRVEADNVGVVEALTSHLGTSLPHHYLRIVASPEVHDVRAFRWAGFTATPSYTYRLLLAEGQDNIFRSFDQRIRYRAKQAEKQITWEMRRDHARDFIGVLDHVRRRYREQGRRFAPSDRYFSELADKFGGTLLRTHAMITDEQWLSGMIFVRHNGNMKLWLGGMKPRGAFAGVNERLHWESIKESLAEGLVYYERVGANTPHLCKNKSKYNLRPVPYFVLERGTSLGRFAAGAYKRIKSKRTAEIED
jgi:hypothetical protein